MNKRGRHSIIINAIYLLIIILVSTSCQPTPTPATPVIPSATPTGLSITATRTKSPSWTPTNIPTRTPAIISSPGPSIYFLEAISTPDQQSDNYLLRAWSEVDSDEMVAASLRMYDDYSTNIHLIDLAKFTFSSERLLRYPNSPYWWTWAWDLTKVNTEGIPLPGMRPNQSFFSFLVEHMLNEEGVKPESLPDALDEHSFSITGISYGSLFEIRNLFGDGKPVYAFKANMYDEHIFAPSQAVFVVHQVNDKYQVDRLTDWTYAGYSTYFRDYSFQSGDDIDNNGFPEMIMVDQHNVHDFSGFIEWDTINIFEWDPFSQALVKFEIKIKSELRRNGSRYWNPGGYLETWKLGERDQDGTLPIIITRTYVDEKQEPTGEEQQFIHPWSELKWHSVPREEWFTVNSDLIVSADQKAQSLLFGDRDYPKAINYLNQLLFNLGSVSLKYPYRHYVYFHYLLGLAYEMNNQPELAAHTYYQVWQEAPENLFGMAARFKLEPER